MKNNRICRLLEIEYPILQGGMLWLADARLAAAVSNAGALGTLSPYAGMDEKGNPVENLHRQIRNLRQLTEKVFAVNIPLDLPESGLLVDVLLRDKVPVAVTAAGNPFIYADLLHSSGIRILHVVGSVAQAKFAEDSGADALIAEGVEAGGRIGRNEESLVSLLPQVVGAVSTPVVAAGGIADGRGMAAVFALGAVGVQLGTRFIAVDECPAHSNYKTAIVESPDAGTLITRRSTVPVRSLKSRFIKELAAMEQAGEPKDRIIEFIGRGRAMAAQILGDIENGDAYAGMSAGLIREIMPAAAVIRNMMQEYREVVSGMEPFFDRNEME